MTPPLPDPDDVRAVVREYTRKNLLDAFLLENPNAIERRLLDDPRSIAATVLMWAADPGNEMLRKLGDVTTDKRGQSAAWLARAQALREEVRYDSRTLRRSAALSVVTGGPIPSEPVFVITPAGESINNDRESFPGSLLDPERLF